MVVTSVVTFRLPWHRYVRMGVEPTLSTLQRTYLLLWEDAYVSKTQTRALRRLLVLYY